MRIILIFHFKNITIILIPGGSLTLTQRLLKFTIHISKLPSSLPSSNPTTYRLPDVEEA